MDSLAVRAVVAELSAYRGFRVQGTTMIDPWEMHVHLEHLQKETTLVLCVHPQHNSIFAAVGVDALAELAHSFARSTSAALAGTRFQKARQAGLDRVVALAFQRRDRLGDPVIVNLVVELTGRGANLLLVEGDTPWAGKIRDRLRPDRSRLHPRSLRPGGTYSLPSGKLDITQSKTDALVQGLRPELEGEATSGALIRAWLGVSPATAQEIWIRAGSSDPESLTQTWERLMDETRPPSPDHPGGERFSPLVVSPSGSALPYLPHEVGETEANVFPTMSAAVASVHGAFRDQLRSESASPLLRAVHQAIQRVERALAEETRGRESDGPQDLRQIGEALLTVAHSLTGGLAQTEIVHPETGHRLTIRLNPKLSPSENADLYFKRARKAERRAGRWTTRKDELLERRRELEELAKRLGGFAGGDPDPSWFETARRLGVKLPAQAGAHHLPPEERLPASVRPRRYELGGGWVALVGKSNRGNDVLTHEIARPHETWMHADQASGSHLVLRHSEKGKKPPESIVLTAAALAAHFSKARHSAKVPVLVTEKRHVRRPRKARPGTVLVGTHRTVMVEPTDPQTVEEE